MSQTRRRQFLIATGALLAAPLVRAQQANKVFRVALISSTTPIAEMADPLNPFGRALLHELRVLGYIEGRNLIVERRSAEGRPERYSEIAAELVRLKTDVIVAGGGALFIRPVKESAGNIPIVMISNSQVVELGVVAGLARPGGNVTGVLSDTGPENELKRLQLLKELIPTRSRVAYLAPGPFWDLPIAQAIRRGAPSLGVELLHAEHSPTDIDATLAALARQRPDALIASLTASTYAHRREIVEFALKTRLPAIYPYSDMAEMGGLMSYGVSGSDLGRRAAVYVAKILKGARPGDLPIEQVTRFELLVNTKTARAIGITIPQSVLLRADRVIE